MVADGMSGTPKHTSLQRKCSEMTQPSLSSNLGPEVKKETKRKSSNSRPAGQIAQFSSSISTGCIIWYMELNDHQETLLHSVEFQKAGLIQILKSSQHTFIGA